MKSYNVVAALIIKGNQVLISQRGYGEFKDRWEFPGGKIEEGETEQEALVREIKEELRADILVNEHLITVHHDYPSFHLDMHCYLCSLLSEEFHPDESVEEANIFVDMEKLDDVDFLPADIEVKNALQERFKKQSV